MALKWMGGRGKLCQINYNVLPFTDSYPEGIDVDSITGQLYLANVGKKAIESINFKLIITETIINIDLSYPYDIVGDGK